MAENRYSLRRPGPAEAALKLSPRDSDEPGRDQHGGTPGGRSMDDGAGSAIDRRAALKLAFEELNQKIHDSHQLHGATHCLGFLASADAHCRSTIARRRAADEVRAARDTR